MMRSGNFGDLLAVSLTRRFRRVGLMVLGLVGLCRFSSGQFAYAAESNKMVELFLQMQNKSVVLKLSAPADTILLQNPQPTQQSEQAAWQKALAALKSEALIFTFPPSAECSVLFSKLETDVSKRTLKAEDSKQPTLQSVGTGGKVVALYEGNCEKPAQLKSFETSVFAVLQGAQKISLRGERDGDQLRQNVQAPKSRGPVTLNLKGKKPKSH